jgi:hypothetical protein
VALLDALQDERSLTAYSDLESVVGILISGASPNLRFSLKCFFASCS